MNLRDQIRPVAPSIPTASMADIAFLLIIFFMLTTSFSQERTSVQLPESVERSEVSEDAAIIAITADELISFTSGEEQATILSGTEELGQLVAAIVGQIPNKEFVVKADRTTRYELIDGVLDALRTNRAKRIGLLTRPEALP